MESKNLLTLAITLTVGIILAGSLLMPVISDATETEKTFENEGYFFMEKYGVDDDLTISWDHTKPTVITVNDEEVSLPAVATNQWVSADVGDTWCLRWAKVNSTDYYIQLRYGDMARYSADTPNGTDMTIVCNNGTATATKYTNGTAGASVEVTYTEIYTISAHGPYVMKKSNESVSVAGNSQIVAMGITELGAGKSCMVRIDGSISDGVDVQILASTSREAAVVEDSLTINSAPIQGYEGYSLSNIQFIIENEGVETTATYSYFIVPASVTLERTQHLNPDEIALMNALPIIVIIGLVLAGVGAIFVRSRD